MVSMPTINMMDFGGNVSAQNCYNQTSEPVIHIPNYDIHYKTEVSQQALGSCLICKKTICLTAEAIVDIYNAFTTNTKTLIAESINRLVLVNDNHTIPFNNHTICMHCYSQMDRLDALHNEFNLLKHCLREKMSEFLVKEVSINDESSPVHHDNSQMEMEKDSEEITPASPIPKGKRNGRYIYTEMLINSDVLFPCDAQDEYTCLFCFKKYTRKSALAEHFDVEHGKSARIECKLCENDYKGGLKTFMSHMTDKHHLNEIRDALGHIKVKDIALLRRTKNNARDVKKLRKSFCIKCSLTMDENLLDEHITKYHPIRTFVKCSVCCKDVKQNKVKYHMLEQHGIGNPYTCPHCPEQFTKRHRYESHFRRVHSDSPRIKQFQCSKCPKKFFKNYEVKLHHRLVHENLRIHNCHVCHASFKMKGSLNNHMRKHTGIKPYVCQLCEKAFPRVSDCKKHVRKVHKIEIHTRFNDALNPNDMPIKVVGDVNLKI